MNKDFTATHIEPHNPYDAQQRYAGFLFTAIEISWWHPFKKLEAIKTAEKYREFHRPCCEWASEED